MNGAVVVLAGERNAWRRTSVLLLLATLLLANACNSADPATAGPKTQAAQPGVEARAGQLSAPAGCARGDETLPQSGLCRTQAEKLLLDPGGDAPAAADGCVWMIRETAFADDILLYRSLRCGTNERRLEFQAGNHQSDLVYIGADGRPELDGDGDPMVLAKIFAGHPDGRARALWQVRDGMADEQAAQRCDLKPPYREGYPADALIVDTPRSAADVRRDDAVPLCGPFGYAPLAEIFAFWRTHQGYAWYIELGTDAWDIDPSSLTLIHRNAAGQWEPVPTPPPA